MCETETCCLNSGQIQEIIFSVVVLLTQSAQQEIVVSAFFLSAANTLCGLVEEVAWIEDTKMATMMPTQQEKKPHTVNC